MKKIYITFVFTFCCTLIQAQPNLIDNQSFEKWDSSVFSPLDWTINTSYDISRKTDSTDGNYSIELETTCHGSCNGNLPLISMSSSDFRLDAEKTYTVSLDYKVKRGIFNTLNIDLQILNGEIEKIFSTTNFSNEWQTFEFEFSPIEDRFFYITLHADSNDTGEIMLFDNVSIKENVVDKEHLIAIYNATDGPNWDNPWDLTTDVYTWEGVTINDLGRVTELELNSNLSGELPEELGNLTELELLDISLNLELVGNLPNSITNLQKLKELTIGYTGFTGGIPDEIGSLTELEYLYVAFNADLTGTLPSSIGNLNKLKKLNITRNGLTGEFPDALFTLDSLEHLIIVNSLFEDDLTGISNLNNLKIIEFRSNVFNAVPDELWNMTSLVNVDIYNRDYNDGNIAFDYKIPSTVNQLINLEYLIINGNNTEDLPDELWEVPNLKELWLRGALRGPLKETVGNALPLTSLFLDGGLTGNIPKELGLLENLVFLSLGSNNFIGSIPEEIGTLDKLYSLTLSNNELSGEIPESLGNLSETFWLSLSSNNLTGQIPSSFENLNNIELLYLRNNNLSGEIPITLANLPKLSGLRLENNNYVFEDLEPVYDTFENSISFFSYENQKHIDDEETIIYQEGEYITLSVEATQSDNNSYQWQKDGVDIDGATERIYTIPSATSADLGEYECAVINNIVADLILYRNKITITTTLGSDDFTSAGIKAYPNPTIDKIILSLGSLKHGEVTASVYGILGNQVFEQKQVINNQALDFSNLPTGIYVLKLNMNTQTFTSRIVKQ
ncbi:hypothetical protein GCM10022393_21000 [Aquimarina addita]|uniref:Ig-like domain-containing protein n=1 Tax=Aquimarina addita TaxID=870485 RepID=A0ABP6UIP9_9FLAO